MFFAVFPGKLAADKIKKEWINHEACAFVSGLCIGMVAGATVDRMTSDRKARRAVSKTMERMGKAMDSAFEDVKSCLP